MNKIKVILSWIYEQIKTPLIIFCMFFFGGIGLYHGVMVSTNIGKLTIGTAVVITFVDLHKDDKPAE